MARDVQFGQWMAETAVTHNFHIIHVDGSQTIPQNAVQVATHLNFHS